MQAGSVLKIKEFDERVLPNIKDDFKKLLKVSNKIMRLDEVESDVKSHVLTQLINCAPNYSIIGQEALYRVVYRNSISNDQQIGAAQKGMIRIASAYEADNNNAKAEKLYHLVFKEYARNDELWEFALEGLNRMAFAHELDDNHSRADELYKFVYNELYLFDNEGKKGRALEKLKTRIAFYEDDNNHAKMEELYLFLHKLPRNFNDENYALKGLNNVASGYEADKNHVKAEELYKFVHTCKLFHSHYTYKEKKKIKMYGVELTITQDKWGKNYSHEKLNALKGLNNVASGHETDSNHTKAEELYKFVYNAATGHNHILGSPKSHCDEVAINALKGLNSVASGYEADNNLAKAEELYQFVYEKSKSDSDGAIIALERLNRIQGKTSKWDSLMTDFSDNFTEKKLGQKAFHLLHNKQ